MAFSPKGIFKGEGKVTTTPRFLFAIRDDDTSYYTHPEELAAVYKGIWDTVPVSLSVIPFAAPFGQVHPHFRRDDPLNEPLKSLNENQELVCFLQNLLKENKVEILLHGYSHEYKKIRGKWVAECIWKSGKQLREEIMKGKRYLENLLGVRIKVFVPPSNRINSRGIQVIEEAGMNLSGILGPWGDRPFSLAYLTAWARRWSYWLLHKGPYPYVLDLGKHKELVAYSLTPSTDWQKLIKRLELCARIGAPFVVATHYWELIEYPQLHQQLRQLIDLALVKGAKPLRVSECYER